MQFAVLTSGSKANCTFVEVAGKRILIDCGLSGKQTALRLGSIGIDPDSLDAIVITHEHSDHINGVSVMSRRHKIPVYANEGTAQYLSRLHGLEIFKTGTPFTIGSALLHPFSVVHDAQDPVGFTIESEGLKLAHITDLGRVTPVVQDRLRFSHAVILESNHDAHLLNACDYPWQLKQRIASSHGHLSNKDAADLLLSCWHSDMLHVVLGHLSENSNTPQHALSCFYKRFTRDTFYDVHVGSIHNTTPLMRVGERPPEADSLQAVGSS